MTVPATLDSDYGRLADAVQLAEVDAYVHVGDGTDDLVQYLTRIDPEDNLAAFVLTEAGATAVIRPRYRPEAERKFPGGTIVETESGKPLAETVTELFEAEPSVRVPDTTPVGVVRGLESNASVEVIPEPDTVWCRKSEDEQAVAAHMADGVQRGIARAETVLADATVDGDAVVWDGDELTTERLRREISKELADFGLRSMGNVVIGAGESCAELHFTGDEPIRPEIGRAHV